MPDMPELCCPLQLMPLSSYTGGICIIDNFCSKMSTGSNTSGSQPTSAPRLPWLPLMLCLGALFLAVAIYSWRQRAKVTSLLQKGEDVLTDN